MFDDHDPRVAPQPDTTTADAVALSPAVERFRSCRWYKPAERELHEHCSHRDVLPMAGTSGFNAEAWCPDCPHYKVRRGARRPANEPR
ncbi:MAG: hypothetical protein U0Q12_18605 [Vicinamibacterales bacterium]